MQADNEQAARTKHARRGISAPAEVSPAAVTVCVPRRGQPGLLLPMAAAPRLSPSTPKPESSPSPTGSLSRECLGLALGQNHSGTALAKSHKGWSMESSCFQGFRALPGKGTAPTSPQPGFGLGHSLPGQEGTLWCSHIGQQHRFDLWGQIKISRSSCRCVTQPEAAAPKSWHWGLEGFIQSHLYWYQNC